MKPSNTPYQKMGKMLQELRAEHGLNQARMAKKLQLTQPQLSRLENGQQGLRFEVLLRLARCCDCRPSHLLASAGL